MRCEQDGDQTKFIADVKKNNYGGCRHMVDVSYSNITDFAKPFCDAILESHIGTLDMSGLDLTMIDWRIIHSVNCLVLRNCHIMSTTSLATELSKNTSLHTLDMLETPLVIEFGDHMPLISAIVASNIRTLALEDITPAISEKLQYARNLRTFNISVDPREDPEFPNSGSTFEKFEKSKCDAIVDLLHTNRNILDFTVLLSIAEHVYRKVPLDYIFSDVHYDVHFVVYYALINNRALHSDAESLCRNSSIALYVALRHLNPYIFNKDVTKIISAQVVDTHDYQIWRDTCLRIDPNI